MSDALAERLAAALDGYEVRRYGRGEADESGEPGFGIASRTELAQVFRAALAADDSPFDRPFVAAANFDTNASFLAVYVDDSPSEGRFLVDRDTLIAAFDAEAWSSPDQMADMLIEGLSALRAGAAHDEGLRTLAKAIIAQHPGEFHDHTHYGDGGCGSHRLAAAVLASSPEPVPSEPLVYGGLDPFGNPASVTGDSHDPYACCHDHYPAEPVLSGWGGAEPVPSESDAG